MYGDTTRIRQLANGLRDQAELIREQAATIRGRADTPAWQGLAAQAMRLQVHADLAALERCSVLHEAAAVQLHLHAQAVDDLKDLIGAIQDAVRELLETAGDKLADFVPPPPGHRDWLSVDLPGLRRAL